MRALSTPIVIALLGCGASRVPCTGPAACGAGSECVANRCDERGAGVAERGSERIVLEPTELAVVAQHATPSGLPVAVTFGSRALGRAALFMRFPPQHAKLGPIESAFLLLEPMPSTPADSQDFEIEAWRVRRSWQGANLSWSAQPDLALPKASGIARGTPRQALRIDVTEIVRYLAERTAHTPDHGLALLGGSGEGHGASYATGASGVRGPRLEIYVRAASRPSPSQRRERAPRP
jgi:hypothetical protein